MSQSAFAEHTDGEAGDGAPLRGARTLVVEDSAILATEITEILDELGCFVVGPATSVAAVKALVEAEEIDAAVLDINLNGVRTFEPAATLAALKIPFVFVSGYSETSVPEEFGNVRFLRKPVDPAMLAVAIGEALKERVDGRRNGLLRVD